MKKRVIRVLLVDDEQAVREVLQLGLVHVGAEVVSAESGEDALRIFRDDRNFRLVISDYRMPGMNGIETVGAIKQIDPSVQAVIVSGFPPEITPEDMEKVGVKRVLRKPLTLEHLAVLVRFRP